MTTEPLDLEPIKARLAAAMPWPWVWIDHSLIPEGVREAYNSDGTPHEWGGRYALMSDPPADPALASDEPQFDELVIEMVEDEVSGDVFEIPIEDADAALIANAPADIAALVAEVERLRALVAQRSGT